jgi:glycosyltransferase involved in cell wall biosynthesis
MAKKILIVIDSKDWAIDHLAQVKIKYNPHYDFKAVYVHPRDATTTEAQARFKEELLSFNPDIVHFEYFNSAKPLLDNIPELQNYKMILTHHNQKEKALGLCDWNKAGINHLVTHTNKAAYLLIEKFLQARDRTTVIHHGIDLEYFEYNSDLTKSGFIGYCGRIVPWKGLKEILMCAKELNRKVLVVGKMDKADYWKEIEKAGLEEYCDFTYFNCSDEERVNAYHSMEVFVNNSEDGYEEGPLPYLEAMACGVPVITTPSGVAHETAVHENNALITRFKDKENLLENIKRLLDDDELKQTLKGNAWTTVKNMSDKKMAREYDVLYQRVLCGKEGLVSIILPTYNRFEKVKEILLSLNEQTYKNFEVILCDDNSEECGFEMVCNLRPQLIYPIKYINTLNSGYGLAQARNMGAIESVGEVLMFLDSRMKPDSDVVKRFYDKLKDNYSKIWYFGNKGYHKTAFVENFSAVRRSDFMSFGMFCERMDAYGGLSEETRIRWTAQDGLMKYCEEIKAHEILSSKKDNHKRQQIIDMKLRIHKMYGGQDSGYNPSLKYR